MHRRYLQCWQVLFFLLLLTHVFCLHHLWDVRHYASRPFCSLVDLFFFCPLNEGSRVSYEGYSPSFYLFDEISSLLLDIHVLLRYSCLFFLSSPLVWWCPLPILPSICKVAFLRAFWFFPDLIFLSLPSYVIFRFSLLAWNIFLGQILFLYRHCISPLPVRAFNSFSYFAIFQSFTPVVTGGYHWNPSNRKCQISRALFICLAISLFSIFLGEWSGCYSCNAVDTRKDWNLKRLSLDPGDKRNGQTCIYSLVLRFINILIFQAISVSIQTVFHRDEETPCIF